MIRTVPLKNVKYTGRLMKRLAVRYVNDVAPYAHMSVNQFFDKLKRIPWRSDGKGREKLQRPYHTLAQNGIGGDCDDKNIALGAFLHLHGIPFRFVALATNGRYHHVATEAHIDGKYIHLDPTYSFNTWGLPMTRYKRRLIISED